MKPIVLPVLFSLAAGCNQGTTLRARETEEFKEPNYGYMGDIGPLLWHTIKTDKSNYTLCAKGTRQSPINVDGLAHNVTRLEASDFLKFRLDDYPRGAEIENLGTTIEVPFNGSLFGGSYNLTQFHFHTPGEHAIKGEGYPMEVHFVFKAAGGATAVVGIPIEVSSDRSAVSRFLTNVLANVDEIPDGGDKAETQPLRSNEIESHVSGSYLYAYSGSFTTPPCTEGVFWNVVESPLYIDPTSYRRAKGVIGFNSRYLQGTLNDVNLLEKAAMGLSSPSS